MIFFKNIHNINWEVLGDLVNIILALMAAGSLPLGSSYRKHG